MLSLLNPFNLVQKYRRFRRSQAIAQNPTVRFAHPGHFYSPLPDLEAFSDPNHPVFRREMRELPGINLNLDGQLRFLEDLLPHFQSFPWRDNDARPGTRFTFDQHFFGHADAMVLYAMLRKIQPKTVIEVGSGFSSAVMLDTRDLHKEWRSEFTFIEPYPDRLQGLIRESDRWTARLIEKPVQQVDRKLFRTLQSGDLLFIDSSHVSKIGSDVNLLFLEILPELPSGVYVHIHDIFWPFEYPSQWIQEGRAWNEAYLLKAFLMFNSAFEICIWNSLVAHRYSDWLKQNAPLFLKNSGGSFYMRKR